MQIEELAKGQSQFSTRGGDMLEQRIPLEELLYKGLELYYQKQKPVNLWRTLQALGISKNSYSSLIDWLLEACYCLSKYKNLVFYKTIHIFAKYLDHLGSKGELPGREKERLERIHQASIGCFSVASKVSTNSSRSLQKLSQVMSKDKYSPQLLQWFQFHIAMCLQGEMCSPTLYDTLNFKTFENELSDVQLDQVFCCGVALLYDPEMYGLVDPAVSKAIFDLVLERPGYSQTKRKILQSLRRLVEGETLFAEEPYVLKVCPRLRQIVSRGLCANPEDHPCHK